VPRVKNLTLPPPATASVRTRAAPQVARSGDAALVAVTGMVDELFPGFGDLSDARVAVIDLGGITFMTSFGVRQWLRSMAAIPSTVTHLYLLRCPTIIVDQLNMILNFGGRAKILSLAAPFVCTKCSASSKEIVDVLAEGAMIRQGQLAPRVCKRCGSPMVLDELVESYFACLTKYGAVEADHAALQLVANAETLQLTAVKPSVQHAPETGTIAQSTAVIPAKQGSIVPKIVVGVILTGVAVGVYLAVGPR
jgi:hypothetical protein